MTSGGRDGRPRGVSPFEGRGDVVLLVLASPRFERLSWSSLLFRVLCARVCRSIRIRPPPPRPRRFRRALRFFARAVIRHVAATESSSRQLRAPSQAVRLSLPGRARQAPSMGSRTSSRPRRPESTTDGRSTAHLTFRPRRFSRPRRFAPSILSWACFIPLPRPGFASGVSSRHPVRADSSPSRSSPPLVSSSCLRFRAGAGSRHVDLEGSILDDDPQSPAEGLVQQPIRVPSCVLLLLRVSLSATLVGAPRPPPSAFASPDYVSPAPPTPGVSISHRRSDFCPQRSFPVRASRPSDPGLRRTPRGPPRRAVTATA